MRGVKRRKMKLLGLKKGSSLKRGNASKTIGILSDHGLWQILIGSGIHDDLDISRSEAVVLHAAAFVAAHTRKHALYPFALAENRSRTFSAVRATDSDLRHERIHLQPIGNSHAGHGKHPQLSDCGRRPTDNESPHLIRVARTLGNGEIIRDIQAGTYE